MGPLSRNVLRPAAGRSKFRFLRGPQSWVPVVGSNPPPSPLGESIMRKHGTQLEHWLANSWPTSHEYSWIISGHRPPAINATNTNCPADWCRTFDYLGALLLIPSIIISTNLTLCVNKHSKCQTIKCLNENWLVNRPTNYSNETPMNLAIRTGCYWLWTLNAARHLFWFHVIYTGHTRECRLIERRKSFLAGAHWASRETWRHDICQQRPSSKF